MVEGRNWWVRRKEEIEVQVTTLRRESMVEGRNWWVRRRVARVRRDRTRPMVAPYIMEVGEVGSRVVVRGAEREVRSPKVPVVEQAHRRVGEGRGRWRVRRRPSCSSSTRL